jgi:hypothetical protein
MNNDGMLTGGVTGATHGEDRMFRARAEAAIEGQRLLAHLLIH